MARGIYKCDNVYCPRSRVHNPKKKEVAEIG
jgi:hypothetical protein